MMNVSILNQAGMSDRGIPQAGAGAEAVDKKTAQNSKFVQETFAKIGFERATSL